MGGSVLAYGILYSVSIMLQFIFPSETRVHSFVLVESNDRIIYFPLVLYSTTQNE